MCRGKRDAVCSQLCKKRFSRFGCGLWVTVKRVVDVRIGKLQNAGNKCIAEQGYLLVAV